MPAVSTKFGKALRVRQGWEYKRAYRKGRRFHHPTMTLVVFRAAQPKKPASLEVSDSEKVRLGLSVSRKVGKAVVRNQLKRRLREIFRLHRPEMSAGHDVVAVPRASAAGLAYRDLEKIFMGLCRKAKLLAGPEPKEEVSP